MQGVKTIETPATGTPHISSLSHPSPLETVTRGTSPIPGDAPAPNTPPVILYSKESSASESPGHSPKKSSIRSPLHLGKEEDMSSSPSTPSDFESSRIASLEAEIVSLKSYIERLERELGSKKKNRFLCFG